MATVPGVVPKSPIPARPASPPRVGLLATVSPVDDGVRWQGGFSFSPETCASGRVYRICVSEEDVIPDGVDWTEVTPVKLETGDRCTALGWTARNFTDRVKGYMSACESALIANELWTGAQAQAGNYEGEPYGNPYFTAPGADLLSAAAGTSPIGSLGCLERYLGDCACGQRGMIHAPRDVVTWWIANGLIDREAGALVTKLGNYVIPDAGYPGTPPDGVAEVDGVQWAFATLMVDVRLDTTSVVPETIDQATDHSTNTIEWRAWKFGAAYYDPCCRGAVGVQVDDCSVT